MVVLESILLFVLSFLPPITYMVWMRNTEKYNKEPWKAIVICFIWGATISIIAALILELVLSIPVAISFQDASIFAIISAVIIAPFAEELTKPIGMSLKTVKKELDETEDGFIYGAIAGLGFSATENLFYGSRFLSEGLLYFIVMISIRSVGACLLHAGATAWTGYGYGKVVMKHSSILKVLPYFGLAIFIHAFYNLTLSIAPNDVTWVIVGFGIAILFAVLTVCFVRKKIKTLDMQSAQKS